MLTVLALLQATEPPHPTGTSIDSLYYVLASIALVLGFIEGMRRFLMRQRGKWVDEGKAKAEAIRVQRENSEQLKANTDAIAKLTATQSTLSVQLTEFVASVHAELNGLGKRISRLEVFARKGEDRQSH